MMSLHRSLYAALTVFVAIAAAAQQRPIFDVDDFVHPGQREGPVFISRLVMGAARSYVDDYRPVHQDAGFIHVANSFYWKKVQFDYKHSEVRAENDPPTVRGCPCNPPIYFPTPSPDSTPAAPPPGSKDSLQFAWYHPKRGDPAEPPVMLRYRLTWSRQSVNTDVRFPSSEEIVQRLHGHEQSFGLEAETYLRIREHDIFGSVLYARTTRHGMPDDRTQQELTYINRFPGRAVGKFLVRATLTVGGVSSRGGTGLNVVNPYFEAFRHFDRTQINLHLVYSPQATRSGAGGWETHHQIAIFADYALWAKFFR